MARTPKQLRKWVKQEKQLVYLMYRKGFLINFKISDFYWESYKEYWHDKKSIKYKWGFYVPEIHYFTTDYWGESDEHSIVDYVLEGFYWTHIDKESYDPNVGEYPKSLFPKMNRIQLIKYLKNYPVKIGDKKINKVLNRRIEI